MTSTPFQVCQRKYHLIFLALAIFNFYTATAQECSATQLCATGCCSSFGFCGTDSAHCGTGCLSTCDYKLGCDANNPCAAGTGCCSKFGFCGLGPDYCAPDLCVANCDSKSYCDPGYSASGYAEVEACPLNVCCSKFGFCGLTEEFCGNKTVTRPSCSSSGATQRVVGYYEGWANRRACEEFPPKMIPLGVYTHINFAFASINPTTFEVVPGDPGDVDLYQQVTLLKGQQPDLKVFIAIGGWTFNDPGPTATTFHDLAASTANQNKFFTSLTSFMSTYNFDGVDIDWEYPAADDRSGQPEDFANFPTFIANLKSHLKSTGGRSGVSITLPASYWYLQHFDIVKLQDSVDFFNIMTYDLHGLWDKGNKWLGNFLNAHTNLTEITISLDLLWRNKINPSKINLGLAFYARTFTMSDPSCTEPGCLFDSAGDAGLCTNSVGTLSNAEIADRIKESGLTPVHYTDAAVKVITWGNQWVAYDDADTYLQKAEFARSECLGGVMVWALSQDSSDLASSGALATATGSDSYATFQEKTTGDPAEPTTTSTTTVKNRQCRWSDCGAGCDTVGDNFINVYRSSGLGDDEAGHVPFGETIQDSTYCGSKSILRQFCCPAEFPAPACAHFYMNNGNCNGDNTNSCTAAGYVEIGSINQDCNTSKKGGYEQICCTTQTKSMTLYNQCMWNGQPGKCDTKLTTPVLSNSCPATQFTTQIAASAAGSGGTYCGELNGLGNDGFHFQHRDYCCANDQANQQWSNCFSATNVGPVPPGQDPDHWCQSGCPVGKVRVAMDNALSCYENGGAEAWCCDDNYTYTVTTTTVNAQLLAYQAAAADFVSNGVSECANYNSGLSLFGGGLRRRSIDTNRTEESSLLLIEGRQSTTVGDASVLSMISLLYVLLTNAIDANDMLKAYRTIWDNAMEQLGYAYLAFKTLQAFVTTDIQFKFMSNEDISKQVPCNEDIYNSAIMAANSSSADTDNGCSQWTIVSLDTDFFDGDQDYIDSEGSSTPITRRNTLSSGLQLSDFPEIDPIYHELDKRDGAPRNYAVDLGIGPNGQPQIIIILSWVYPSGANGQALVDATGSNIRYSLADDANCRTAIYSSTGDPEAVPAWVVEHIFELQTVARLLEFIVLRVLPSVTTGGVTVPSYSATNPGIPAEVLLDWFQLPYEHWPAGANVGGLTGRPDQRLMYQLGAKGNANHLVLMDAVGNRFKGAGWSLKAPISDDTWVANGYTRMTPTDGNNALSAIRGVLGVLSYLSLPTIDDNLHAVVQALHLSLREFQTTFNANTFLHGMYINALPIWDEGVLAWGSRMDYFIRNWAYNRIAQLRATWAAALAANPVGSALHDYAAEMIATLDALFLEAENTSVNLNSFQY